MTPLEQARALLQRARTMARLRLGVGPSGDEVEAHVAAIDAFLAGLPSEPQGISRRILLFAFETITGATYTPDAQGQIGLTEAEKREAVDVVKRLRAGLPVVAEAKPETPPLAVGMRVRCSDGSVGQIASEDGGGFRVRSGENCAWFHANELKPLTRERDGVCNHGSPHTCRTFEPTAEEVAAFEVLAEVAGKPEHEAVVILAQRVYAAAALTAQPSASTLPQPRVGPWVDEDGESKRFDDHGFQVGDVWGCDEDGFEWVARRAGMAPARGEDGTREGARAAVDAVLATWANLD